MASPLTKLDSTFNTFSVLFSDRASANFCKIMYHYYLIIGTLRRERERENKEKQFKLQLLFIKKGMKYLDEQIAVNVFF